MFAGWNTRADGKGKSYANKAAIRNLTAKDGATITLYAQWEKVKEETPEVPVSGESSHVGMYLCVMLAAAAGAVWMLVLKRKFQQQ